MTTFKVKWAQYIAAAMVCAASVACPPGQTPDAATAAVSSGAAATVGAADAGAERQAASVGTDAGSAAAELDGGAAQPGLSTTLPPGKLASSLDGGPRVFVGHTEPLLTVTFSPDGTLLATGGLDHTVRIWDLVTNEQKAALDKFPVEVSALAFSPDGQLLLAGDRQFGVHVFDAKTFEAREHFLHTAFVSGLQVNRAQTQIAVAGATGNSQLMELRTGKTICELLGRSASFNTDGSEVVTALPSGALARYRVLGCKLVREIKTAPHLPFATSAGDFNQVLTWNGNEPDVRIWSMSAGKQVGSLTGHHKGVSSVSLSADGRWAATASADLTLKRWSVAKRQAVDTFSLERLGFAAISPDGKHIAAVDGISVKVWEVQP